MKKKTFLTVLVIIVLLIYIIGLCGFWFVSTHVFVGGKAYSDDEALLDLRDRKLSIEEYEQIRQELPDSEVLWQIPFQGAYYPEDTDTLKVVSLSPGDMKAMSYFPDLKCVDASECRDLNVVFALMEQYPELDVKYSVYVDGSWYSNDVTQLKVTALTEQEAQLLAGLPNLKTVDAEGCTDYDALLVLHQQSNAKVSYSVPMCGKEYPSDTREITLDNPDISQLKSNLGYLPELERLYIVEPECPAQELRDLQESYPETAVVWEKTVYGMTLDSEITELDISNILTTTQEAEAAAAYFPKLEKLIMSYCEIDNETMAAFRDKMRSEYKVVWTVIVTGEKVRTDDTIFHSSGRHMSVNDETAHDLFYCEDMIIVDIGHSHVKYVEWVRGMPNLKYLILADNWIKDITPLGSCKNLVYLELFINDLFTDISPLIGCTALEDVNVADTFVDVRPFAQMPWLKNLWINNNSKCKQADVDYLTENLPNTHIASGSLFTTGGGWRELQNYYDMRELMGLPCNRW